MSSRRSTLKRPVVCRSKKEGNCGTCTLDFELEPQAVPVNGAFVMHITIECTKDPMDKNYTLYYAGPPVGFPDKPMVTVGPINDFPCVADLPVGTYKLTILAVNSQGCLLEVFQLLDVF